ncbi:hypothetical protein [Vibrio parahaemolyticus]|uniref:hypothetical protein n=1 Tax=Vibrio parahaemolyticus TaxID=670 RepID=UPI001301716C|nr:hypothetical protein [Vibrio parahaemolyticus]
MANRAYIAKIKLSNGDIVKNVWNGSKKECEQHFKQFADKVGSELVAFKNKAAKARYGW